MMGLWSFYFLAKFILYLSGSIRMDFILNGFFLAFLIVPLPDRFKNNGLVSGGRAGLNAVLAALLLWHESWLPPVSESIAFLREQGVPTKEYVARFLSGAFSPAEAVFVLLALVFCVVANRYIRLTPLVVVLLLIVPLREFGPSRGEAAAYLDQFHRAEAARTIRFDPPEVPGPDFDIILLHVCSLSWDDLEGAGLSGNRFFETFDLLLTHFNSVTSYTNPAAIRLLRSNCGQPGHDDLYRDAPDGCYLLESLRGLGFQTYTAINHDPSFSNFAEQIESFGRADAPLDQSGVPILARNYDNSPVLDDSALLEKWWSARQRSGVEKAALYYDTTSLHGGVHWTGDKTWWKRDPADLYRQYADRLFSDLTGFFDRIESSGRRAVVVFVPEHGMALRGSALQPPDLRDIPLPRITTVPVGIKFIGDPYGAGGVRQRIISKPASYLAISYLLAALIEKNPFGPDGPPSDAMIEQIPKTDYVSENQNIRIVKMGSEYLLFGKERKWKAIPANALN